MLKWILKKLIERERDRQINLYGYDAAHDDQRLDYDPIHLLVQAYVHYDRGHFIQALALLQAQQDANARVRKSRLGDSK